MPKPLRRRWCRLRALILGGAAPLIALPENGHSRNLGLIWQQGEHRGTIQCVLAIDKLVAHHVAAPFKNNQTPAQMFGISVYGPKRTHRPVTRRKKLSEQTVAGGTSQR
jgi:hypothetical protein